MFSAAVILRLHTINHAEVHGITGVNLRSSANQQLFCAASQTASVTKNSGILRCTRLSKNVYKNKDCLLYVYMTSQLQNPTKHSY